MGVVYAFHSRHGVPHRVIHGDPEAEYYLQRRTPNGWEYVYFEKREDQLVLGAVLREVVRLALPDDPSLT